MVFDDLHWADAASLAYIEALADLAESAPVLVVATLRPERGSDGFRTVERLRQRFARTLHLLELQPLDEQASEALLDHLLEIRDLPASTRATILSRSEGNPFFVEEVLRSLIDSDHIHLAEGEWHARPDIVDVTIPETLAGVLNARLDRLPERARKVIQTASVFGRTFPYPILATVCDDAADAERISDPKPQIQTLTDEGLVQEHTREPELDYIFKHALTRDAAYGQLLLRRRRDLHRRIGLAMEAFYAERREEIAPVLAEHFLDGNDWGRAIQYAEEGAQRALDVFSGTAALEMRDIACKAYDRDPQALPLATVDAILAWAEVALKRRTRGEILARLARAEEIARGAGDVKRLAYTLNWIGNAHIMAGFPSEGMTPLKEAMKLAEQLGDEQLMMLPLFLTTVTIVDEDPHESIAKLDAVIEAARKFKSRDVEAHTLGAKANALARLGRFADARTTIEQALALALLTQSAIKIADVNSLAGMVYITLGDPVRAAEHGHRAAEMADSVHGLDCKMYAHMVHGLAQLRSGEIGGAVRAFQDATSIARERGPSHYSYRVMGLDQIAAYRNGDRQAKPRVLRSIEDAVRAGDGYTAALFSDELARADLAAGHTADAAAEIERAITYYSTRGMVPAWRDALEALVQVRQAEGKEEEITPLRDEIARLSARIQPASPELAT
jgi:tetratricopeptide (TPR) repeat protein